MADDPDAMWKPGYAPDAPHVDSDEFPDHPTDDVGGLPDRFRSAAGPRSRPAPAAAPPPVTRWIEGADDPDDSAPGDGDAGDADVGAGPPRDRWRRWAVAGAGVAALAVAAIVAVALLTGDGGSDRRSGPFPGADERRLPLAVEPLWATVLPGTGNALATELLVDGRDLVVTVVDDGSRNRTLIAGIDAGTGAIRWRRSFSFAPPEVSLVGALDGVVLVAQNDLARSRLMGLSADDGATRWERETVDGGVDVVLLGTRVVAHVGSEFGELVTVVDPRTGEDAGTIAGELVTTDLAGTWYVANAGEVVSVDLTDGWTEPDAVVSGGPAAGVIAVVDGRLLVADGDGRVSELTADGPAAGVPLGGEVPLVGSMFPAGPSRLVGLNDGEIFGLELIGDELRVVWRRTASLRSFALTERGLVLAVSDAGIGFVDGVDLLVVDGATGERLAGAGAVADLDALPLIVGDGFITTAETVIGQERVGYDLDGTELWRMPGEGTLRVGDELVVTMVNSPAGFEVTAFGDGG